MKIIEDSDFGSRSKSMFSPTKETIENVLNSRKLEKKNL